MTTRMPDDALALLRECQDRVLDREGIPMILALIDETSEPTHRPTRQGDGEELASLMAGLGHALAPSGREADLGRVASVLQAAAYADFGQGRTVL